MSATKEDVFKVKDYLENQELDSPDQILTPLSSSVHAQFLTGNVSQTGGVSKEETEREFDQLQLSDKGDLESDSVATDAELVSASADKKHGNLSNKSETSQPAKFAALKETLKNQNTNFRYRTDHKERGHFVIFNQKTFNLYNEEMQRANNTSKNCLNERDGTCKDVDKLETTFRKLGFEYVETFTDLTKLEIKQKIENFSCMDHSEYDYFGCAILTHGGANDELYACDAPMYLDDFTKPFRADQCESLAGKPKLFFIQACRGKYFDDGHTVESDDDEYESDGEDDDDEGIDENLQTIPVEADFLIAHSTAKGYSAWRNMERGSWFIRSLCEVFDRFGQELEIMQLMTRVNAMLALDFETSGCGSGFDRKKQIPSIATRLTAEVYFPPKKVTPEHQMNDNVNIKENFRYKTDHKKRGCFVIFNQKNFDILNDSKTKRRFKDRKGTDKDAENLENTFKKLGFEYVRTFKDKTKCQIENIINALAKADHFNYDCFGCAILTHGGKGEVLYARDEPMHLDDFTKPFRANQCASLARRPKLFFIQACRGKEKDVGQSVKASHVVGRTIDNDQSQFGKDSENVNDDNDDEDDDDEDDDEYEVDARGFEPLGDDEFEEGVMIENRIVIPVEADFLIANATVEGYSAYRSKTKGSLFIQTICDVFNNKGKEWEIMQLMTRVNATVGLNYKNKQIPSIATRLTAELYFSSEEESQESQVSSQPPRTSTAAEAEKK